MKEISAGKKKAANWVLYTFSFLIICYLVFGIFLLLNKSTGYDEIFYTIKSWWLFSGKTGWYSDSVALWYFPGAYLFSGFSQFFLGAGLLEARLPGLLSGFFALTATFFYVNRIADPQSALLAVSLLIGSSAILSWPTVSTYALSTFLIVGVLIFSSDQVVSRRLFRIVGISVLMWMLIFTRLNHWISVTLLIPAIYLSTENRSFTSLIHVMLLVAAMSFITLMLLPNNFSQQVGSFGLLPLIYKFLPFLPQPEALVAIPTAAEVAPTSPVSASSSLFSAPVINPDAAFGFIQEFLLRIPPAVRSLSMQVTDFSSRLLPILLGVVSFFFTRKSVNHRGLLSALGLAFLVSLTVNSLYGYMMCYGCDIIYSSYFIGPGAIVAGIGLAHLMRRLRGERLPTVILCVVMVALFAFRVQEKIEDHPFTAAYKSDINQLALEIADRVPAEKNVLPFGFLDKQPISWGLFHAEKTFPAPLLTNVFSFRPTNLDITISDAALADLIKARQWSHHNYVKWIEYEYDYLIKPTWLYYEDHPGKYWFRNVYYPVALRELISKHFDCIRLPGTYHEIPELDFCVRKADSTS